MLHKAREVNKGKLVRKEERRLSLFADDMAAQKI
jgi:hypothetical protein